MKSNPNKKPKLCYWSSTTCGEWSLLYLMSPSGLINNPDRYRVFFVFMGSIKDSLPLLHYICIHIWIHTEKTCDEHHTIVIGTIVNNSLTHNKILSSCYLYRIVNLNLMFSCFDLYNISTLLLIWNLLPVTLIYLNIQYKYLIKKHRKEHYYTLWNL